MKSDHPVLDSRYLLFEAQQAHHYGLSASLALASITTAPAKTAGMSHRVGSIKLNYDADIVLWDSHPLSLGATPLQVYIDGIVQLDQVFQAKEMEVGKDPPASASRPQSPLTLREDDIVLVPAPVNDKEHKLLFVNVGEVILKVHSSLPSSGRRNRVAKGLESFFENENGQEGHFNILVRDGKMSRVEESLMANFEDVRRVDLKG